MKRSMTAEELEVMKDLNSKYRKAKLPVKIYWLRFKGKSPHRTMEVKADWI